jgi:quinol monooxygenase YgiN
MIQATVKMEFQRKTADEAVAILYSLVERIRASRGCVGCAVYQEVENPLTVVFDEKWMSEADLHRHLRSEDYQKILMVMEMAEVRPVIRFETVADMGGVEIIEEARGSKGA